MGAVIFGWAAPPLIEQFPTMPANEAGAFDEDNRALVRLHVRGIISDAERDRAIKRLTRCVAIVLLRPVPARVSRPPQPQDAQKP